MTKEQIMTLAKAGFTAKQIAALNQSNNNGQQMQQWPGQQMQPWPGQQMQQPWPGQQMQPWPGQQMQQPWLGQQMQQWPGQQMQQQGNMYVNYPNMPGNADGTVMGGSGTTLAELMQGMNILQSTQPAPKTTDDILIEIINPQTGEGVQ